MNISEHLIPVPASHINLLEFLRVLSLFVHFPFMGIVFGSAICSIVFALMGRREKQGSYFFVASQLGRIAAYKKSASFFLGILPMVTIMLIDMQLLYDSGLMVQRYQPVSLILVLVGFIALFYYKNEFLSERSGSIRHLFSGFLGILLLLSGYSVFLAVQVRLNDPEKWPFIGNAFELLWSWSVLIKLKMFIAISFSLTGTAILLFLYRWRKIGITGEEPRTRFLAYFSAGMALFFSLVVPVLWIFDIVAMPEIFLSKRAFIVTGAAFILLLCTSLFMYRILKEAKTSLSIPAFFSIVLVFLFEVLFDQFSITDANQEHIALLKTKAEEKMVVEVPVAQKGEVQGKNLVKGKEVFDDICTLCHGFTEEIVGPPLVDVIPKYFGNVEELKSFIRKPVKKNPDYPEMPEPGLEEDEIDAVVDYVFDEVKKIKSKEKQ